MRRLWGDRPWPIHPALFAAFPVLYLYAANLAETDLRDVIVPLAVSVVGATAAAVLAGIAMRDQAKGALAATVAVLLFFSYGYVQRAVDGTFLGLHRVLFPLWILLLLAGVVIAVRAGRRLAATTRALNVAALVLVLLNTVSIASYNIGGRDVEGFGDVPRVAAGTGAEGPERDIYYLIFDRYGGERALQGHFRVNNRPFTDYLRSRGFYVADRSSGNYPRTLHSLASSLNMQHLHEIARRVGEDSSDGGPLRKTLERHAVGRFLKRQGYRYYHLGSWWGPTAKNPMADEVIRFDELSEFSSVLVGTTAAEPVGRKLTSKLDPRLRRWEQTRFQFRELLELRDEPGPKFVFSHFLVPHTPYVFNRDGSFVTLPQKRARTEAESYREQLLYVNSQLERLVERLMEIPESRRPIIILQSDEGPGERPRSWVGVSQDVIEAKFFILNAYYLPGVEDPPLYPTITPVNSFRTVFNLYFGAGLARLPDRVYVFQDIEHQYRFSDITERLFDPSG